MTDFTTDTEAKRVVLEAMHKHEWLHGYIENKSGLVERIISALEAAQRDHRLAVSTPSC